MEAVAREADISRLTIYYQFKSRSGLLEALYDHLANRGNMRQMSEAFREPNPRTALEKMIRTFVQFWASDPVVIRRLRAMSSLDTEIGDGIRARDFRRVYAANEILRRMNKHPREKTEPQNSSVAEILAMLTSFETYDALSRAGQSNDAITEILLKLAHATIVS
jgi:AcrR family transcriptional regulator